MLYQTARYARVKTVSVKVDSIKRARLVKGAQVQFLVFEYGRSIFPSAKA